ncbi:YopX [Bacillus phage vB_BsuS-Goe11]|nr:YopX [Bacillus phage vB_BsuS-Goe11]UIS26538.1 protein YopX [Bacillus phage vB_BsuS-Goe14]
MNTEYRVWDGEQMHYWDDEGLSLTIKSNGDWTLKRLYTDVLVPVVDSTNRNAALMWGTGLKDKNGKDIYEYDIDMIDNEPMIIVYIDGRFGLKYPENHTYFDDCIAWDECDIRGDVYQNPELLEGVE